MDDSVPAYRDAPASSFHESASEPRTKVEPSGKHSVLYALSEGPKLRYLHEDQDNNKGSLQKTHWHSRTTSKNFGDLITAVQ